MKNSGSYYLSLRPRGKTQLKEVMKKIKDKISPTNRLKNVFGKIDNKEIKNVQREKSKSKTDK